MGSGKTTVGPLVAARLGWSFVDVDDAIAAEAGATIPEIFSRDGEAGSATANGRRSGDLWQRWPAATWCWRWAAARLNDAETRALLLGTPETLIVHLEAELATTLARCRGTEHLRPVLADEANLEARYERRLPLYRMAHVSIPVDALTPEEVAEAIVRAAQS